MRLHGGRDDDMVRHDLVMPMLVVDLVPFFYGGAPAWLYKGEPGRVYKSPSRLRLRVIDLYLK